MSSKSILGFTTHCIGYNLVDVKSDYGLLRPPPHSHTHLPPISIKYLGLDTIQFIIKIKYFNLPNLNIFSTIRI